MTLANASERKLTATEPLSLRHLPDEGIRFDEGLTSAWVEGILGEDLRRGGSEWEFTGDGTLTLELRPLGPIETRPPIHVRGHASTRLVTPCVRCLNAVPLEATAQIDITLFPARPQPSPHASQEKAPAGKKPKARAAADEDLEAWDAESGSLDGTDEGTYLDDVVDLPAIIREALLLEVSMNPTCAEVGPCSERTARLIEEANRPAKEAENSLDPRWASLKKLVGDASN